jgi:hypothetical protein
LPVRFTVCGLEVASSVIVSVLVGAAPIDVGLKVSTTVQLAPEATVGLKHVDDGLIAYGVPSVTARDAILRVFGW